MVRHTLKRQNVLCWIKKLYQDTRLARKQIEYSNTTGHYPLRDGVMFIDRDPYGYTRRVQEAIPKRLYPDNINEDSGTEIIEQTIEYPLGANADHLRYNLWSEL